MRRRQGHLRIRLPRTMIIHLCYAAKSDMIGRTRMLAAQEQPVLQAGQMQALDKALWANRAQVSSLGPEH